MKNICNKKHIMKITTSNLSLENSIAFQHTQFSIFTDC